LGQSKWIANAGNYPIHKAVFESNLRNLSKLLKLETEGIFYSEKNMLDPCGHTPLMLAVKLGNVDAVKILTDMYSCPKLRPLQDLMNAKEIAIAMKNQQILKLLIEANQKIKS
jgi:ankyrin repeat protein